MEIPAKERQSPVTLTGLTLDGTHFDISSLRGRVVVINVWGSWCTPCRREAPDLQRAYVHLQPLGVSFLGIDTRDNVAAAKAFDTTFGITYPSLVNDGAMLLAFRGAAPPAAIPTTLVLDTQGRIAGRVIGLTDYATVVGLATDALNTGALGGKPGTAGTTASGASK